MYQRSGWRQFGCLCFLALPQASLVQNWGDEFAKWLGVARVNPIVLTSKGTEVWHFAQSTS